MLSPRNDKVSVDWYDSQEWKRRVRDQMERAFSFGDMESRWRVLNKQATWFTFCIKRRLLTAVVHDTQGEQGWLGDQCKRPSEMGGREMFAGTEQE